jgi:hypothetical protein
VIALYLHLHTLNRIKLVVLVALAVSAAVSGGGFFDDCFRWFGRGQ